MKRNVVLPFGLCAVALLLILALSSCATSRGATLATVLGAQAGSKPAEKPHEPPPPPDNLKGLQVVTSPDNAEVYIDGSFVGVSPVTQEDISVGWHRVVVRKNGYYENATWVQFQGSGMVYEADLEQIIGFLKVTASPPTSIVTVGGDTVPPGTLTLPVGTYTVRVKAFGYTPVDQSVVIAEKALTEVSVSLVPAPFAVTSFSLPKTAVNPDNPGLLGSLEYDVSVTGPGGGSVKVTDGAQNEVYSHQLPDFTTWDQSFTWDLRDTSGRDLPDGSYTMTLTAQGSGADTTEVQSQVTLRVDRSLKIAPRSVWSGSSGLLYAPVAEVLPAGDFQVDLVGAGVGDLNFFQAPVLLGARFGASPNMEIDASAGVIVSSVATPVLGSLAVRWNLLTPHGAYGTAMAVQAKLAAQVNPATGASGILMTDTFADFTGLSVEVPFQLVLDRLSLLLSVGATGSFWYPYRWDTAAFPALVPEFGAVGWLYLRAGAMVDLGSVMFGVSASTRTEPLPGGISLLSSPIPFEAGAEIHWLLPGTRILLSAVAAGEYQDSSNYYFMGGAGLGFLY
jgi:hypothetical protein